MAFGYLSVLLSYLCVNEIVRQRVTSLFQQQTLKPLLDAVEEFLQYHRQIDDEVCHSDEEIDVRTGFIDRLQRVVNELKREQGLSG